MKKYFNLILFSIIFLIPFIVFGQKKDSLYSAKSVGFISPNTFEQDSLQLQFLDSNLNDLQNFNPGFQNRNLNQNLGHYGTANNSLIFEFNQHPGFNLNRSWFQPYIFTYDNLKFYRTKSTYSNLRYVSGGKQEQIFEVNLAKNIGRKTDISIDFQRAVSSGDLQFNDIDHLNIASKIWYQSDSRRYNLLSAFIYNSLFNNENGGLKNDSVFEKPLQVPLEFQSTKITNGRSIYNQREIVISQFYDFGKFKTIKRDTISQEIIIPLIRLQYDARVQDNATRFTEKIPELNFYSNTSNNSSTYDFQNIKSFTQNFDIRLLEKKDRFIFGKIGAEQFIADYKQNQTYGLFSYLKSNADICFRISDNLKIKNSSTYIFQGNFKNDYSNANSLQYFINNKRGFILNYDLKNCSPSLFVQSFISNHFQWKNEFENQYYKNIALHYIDKKYKINAALSQESIKNYIYFDKRATPNQYLSTLIINKFLLQKDFKFHIFYFENTLALQKTNQTGALALPLFSSYHSIYLERFILKKVMKLRVGFDGRFNTKYYANAYMPATGIYYLQDKIQLGDYPVIDFFVSVYLKRAKIFFKVAHINQGVNKEGYYLTPDYPIGKRALKIGISWNFFD